MSKDTTLILAQDVQTRIQDAADRLWAEAGGFEGDSSGSRYEAVCASVASFLSCLSEDCLVSQETVVEAVGGLIMNLRDGMERKFALNIQARALPKRKFEVEVIAYQPMTTIIEVEATCPAEARGKAEAKAFDDIGAFEWEAQGWDNDDIDGAQVTSDCCCNGANHDGTCCPGWFRNADDGDVNRCDECGRFASDSEAEKAAIASGG